MNQKQIEKWELTRHKGLVRFLFLKGVLLWGLPMFVIMTFVVNKTSLDDTSSLGFSLIIWALGGLGFGCFMWRVSDKKYLGIRVKYQSTGEQEIAHQSTTGSDLNYKS